MQIWRTLLAGSLCWATGIAPASAQDPAASPNRFSLSGQVRLLFGSRFGGATPAADIGAVAASGATGTAVNRTYDDGFVNVDISGNASGRTWFWGYQAAGQLAGVGTAGATLSLHSASSPADGTARESRAEGQPGIRLEYSRVVRSWQNRHGQWASWGMDANLEHTNLRLRDNGTVTGMVPLTTDTYLIGGAILPPAPPFAGTSVGPGSMIPDNPNGGRTAAVPTAATAIVQNQVDGDIYAFSTGVFVELPLYQRMLARLSARATVAVVDRTFSFNESVAVTGVSTFTRSGSIGSTDVLIGPSIAARFSFPLHEQLLLHTDAEWQILGRTSQSVGGKSSSLDFNSSFLLSAGLTWKF